ncbi:MAG: peptidoglycan editing factor PgeF [Rhodoferax sp.]
MSFIADDASAPLRGADVLEPDWPAPPGVRALCTTRAGGVSTGAYAALNLGSHVGDDAQAVACNRARLQATVGLYPNYLEQVHGVRVLPLQRALDGVEQADGACTDQGQVVCTVMVADCLPILLSNRAGSWVAALHAGWRGLAGGADGQGVVEQAVHQYQEHFMPLSRMQYGSDATELIAWLGPCIGPQAFEVGEEVRHAFVAADAAAQACFVPAQGAGQWWADLPALARLRLRRQGVQALHGNDGSAPWCTVSQPGRFFSHRRDRVSGRMAACVWIEGGQR